MCIEFLINLYGKWQESDKFKENAFHYVSWGYVSKMCCFIKGF